MTPDGARIYEPHPFALLVPPLTDEEYAALKADIAQLGIMYPAIVDDEDLILDGVHRARIADELGIELPVSQLGQCDDDRKLDIAIGLNMRRRHLDADRRRDFVRKLHREQGLSVRKIAAIAGWSKSTIDRDLKESPFEDALRITTEVKSHFESLAEQGPNETIHAAWADVCTVFLAFIGTADSKWKQNAWPPPPVEHAEFPCDPLDGVRGDTERVGDLVTGMARLGHLPHLDPPFGYGSHRPVWLLPLLLLAVRPFRLRLRGRVGLPVETGHPFGLLQLVTGDQFVQVLLHLGLADSDCASDRSLRVAFSAQISDDLAGMTS